MMHFSDQNEIPTWTSISLYTYTSQINLLFKKQKQFDFHLNQGETNDKYITIMKIDQIVQMCYPEIVCCKLRELIYTTRPFVFILIRNGSI